MFSIEYLKKRAEDNIDFLSEQNEKFEAIKSAIFERAEKESWNIRQGDGTDRPMTLSDLDNVKMTMMNVEQIKYCVPGDDGQIIEHKLCNKE